MRTRAIKKQPRRQERSIGSDKDGTPIQVGSIVYDDNQTTGEVAAIFGDMVVYRVIGGPSMPDGGYTSDAGPNLKVQHPPNSHPARPLWPTPAEEVIAMVRRLRAEAWICTGYMTPDMAGDNLGDKAASHIDHAVDALMLLAKKIIAEEARKAGLAADEIRKQAKKADGKVSP
jgi:hypothetical protein